MNSLPTKTYHPNGIVASIVPRVNNVKHGTTQHFDTQGKLFYTINYQSGVKRGIERFFDESFEHLIQNKGDVTHGVVIFFREEEK